MKLCILTPTHDGVEGPSLVLNTGENIRHLGYLGHIGHSRLNVLLRHCLVLDCTCCQLQQLDIVTTVCYYRNFYFPVRTITQAWPEPAPTPTGVITTKHHHFSYATNKSCFITSYHIIYHYIYPYINSICYITLPL